jgi:hypothetical protein
VKRAAAVLVIALAAAVAARVAVPAQRTVPRRVSIALACGFERWDIKTLKDRPLLLRARTTTVAHLTRLKRPFYLPQSRRVSSERQIFSLIARVTLVRHEADLDLHLVLRSGTRTMIAEAPSALCNAGATARARKQMLAARRAVRLCARARVVGVAFFDFKHGQTGVAPNAIELHPILGFACLAKGRRIPPPPPAPPPPPRGKCAASYPGVCIPPPPPDLNCPDIPFRNFRVRWDVPNPDPHHFDSDRNGIGCQT